jgi:hypothetical protein
MDWKKRQGEQAWPKINEIDIILDDKALGKRRQCMTCFGPIGKLVSIKIQCSEGGRCVVW